MLDLLSFHSHDLCLICMLTGFAGEKVAVEALLGIHGARSVEDLGSRKGILCPRGLGLCFHEGNKEGDINFVLVLYGLDLVCVGMPKSKEGERKWPAGQTMRFYRKTYRSFPSQWRADSRF